MKETSKVRSKRLNWFPLLLIAIIGVFAFWAFYKLLNLVIVTVFFSYLVDFMIKVLKKSGLKVYGWGKGRYIAITYIILFLFLISVMLLVIPPIYMEFSRLVAVLPNVANKFWAAQSKTLVYLQDKLKAIPLLDISKQLLTSFTSMLKGIYGYTSNILSSALSLISMIVIVPLFGFYFTYYKDSIFKATLRVFPKETRDDVAFLMRTFDKAMLEYIKVFLINVLVMSVITTLVLLPFLKGVSLALGIIYGVFSVVPLIGPALGAAPGIIIGFSHGTATGLIVLLLYIVVQQVCDNLISPRIIGKDFAMNPLAVITAMYLAVKALGVAGILVAVPLSYTLYMFLVRLSSKSTDISR